LKKLYIPPTLALFLLSPAIGELLSGSSPPLEFFNPFAFFFMASLYGSGAIIMRELKIRWKKDFRALLLLGAAYGILEEGLMVKSFFDPQWVDLGILGTFGRWAEVNWVWAEMLTIYHAVFSITIPIALVELCYPDRKDERWAGKRLFTSLTVLISAVTVIGFLFLTPYRPPPVQYALTVVAMSLFIYAAYKLPRKEKTKTKGKVGDAKILFFLGVTGSSTFFMLFWAGPAFIDSPIIIMLLGLALILGLQKIYSRYDWSSPSSALSRFAAVAGALSFMVCLAFILEFQYTGMSLVGIATMVGLWLLKRRIRRTG
jgi:hypothetical protein